MPMYDYQCEKCGAVQEQFRRPSEVDDVVQCSTVTNDIPCPGLMTYKASFWYNSETRHAQGFTPVIIHRSSSGDIRFPASADAPVPEGFSKVELTNIGQIRKLEKQINQEQDDLSRRHAQGRDNAIDAQRAYNREVFARQLSSMSPAGRKFYDAMKAMADKVRSKRGDSNFHLEAFSQNASNREAYRDERTGWARGRK